MITRTDFAKYFASTGYKMIIASDTEPKPLGIGGVGVTLGPIATASRATLITRSRSPKSPVESVEEGVRVRRLFFDAKKVAGYYDGFSNQLLWPLCHVVFQEPAWIDNNLWFEQYKQVNREFAWAIKANLSTKQQNFIWINDYQLALVPYFLGRPKNAVVAMFWHIPWPTWEAFRVLPYKRTILESLLACNFLGFHRGYQVANFRRTIGREIEARIDIENRKIFFHNFMTKINNLPLGIDTDAIRRLAGKKEARALAGYFKKYRVILSVDRLDYTKGVRRRLLAVNRFFELYPLMKKKVVHLNLFALSRETIPAYKHYKKQMEKLAQEINRKHRQGNWQPIRFVYQVFSREETINCYQKAAVCLVTPLDDGMNLVSKEFVAAASMIKNPGMLILSQFAGSALDLTRALIVNPYDIDQTALAIKQVLTMPLRERRERMTKMAQVLDERNLYRWGTEFIRQAIEPTYREARTFYSK